VESPTYDQISYISAKKEHKIALFAAVIPLQPSFLAHRIEQAKNGRREINSAAFSDLFHVLQP
jgi:hypothetical protein